MKHPIKIVLLVLGLIVVVSGCGPSPEKDIIGTWQLVASGETLGYVEISEGMLLFRAELDQEPERVAYRLVDLGEDRFEVEIAESYKGPFELLWEGAFDGKDLIRLTEESHVDGTDPMLKRLENLDQLVKEEQSKEEEASAEKEPDEETEDEQSDEAEAEELAALEEEAENKQAQIEQEKRDREKKDRERQEWEEKKKANDAIEKANEQQTKESGLQASYLDRANALDDKIRQEIETHYPGNQDIPYGYIGGYYEEWDELLNDMWKSLNRSMPANEFEQLKANQIEWIKMKERNFADYSDQVASSRAMGMDYLANETKERVYYLLNNY